MQAILHHCLLPLPPSPPGTKLLHAAASAATTTSSSPTLATPGTATNPAAPRESKYSDSPAAAFWDYQLLFISQRSESPEPVILKTVSGSVPADFPHGTYYLAGPGLFADDHGSTIHPLDGHGYLRAFEFTGDGSVRYSARYVSTAARREEREEVTGRWRFTHRGPFSVLRGGRKVGNVRVMKNVANTSVVRWGGRLLCFWEGGGPHEVDPESLDTVGPVDLVDEGWDPTAGGGGGGGGSLAELGVDVAAWLLKPVLRAVFDMPPKRLLAHYKIDPKHNRLLMISCDAEDMLLPRSSFTFYEFDCNFELKQKKEFVISDHLMIHDWAFTDNHYVLLGNRVRLDIPGSLGAVSGLSPMIAALAVNPSQPSTPIYLLPRFSGSTSGARDWRVPVEAPSQLWTLHVGNAFEEIVGTGNLRVQLQACVCSYQWFDFQKMFGYNWKAQKLDPSFMNGGEGKDKALLPHLVQVTIELDAGGTCSQCSVVDPSSQWNRPADFPMINPAFSGRRNSYIYVGAASGSRRFLPHFPFDSLVKINLSDGSVTSWVAGSRRFIGEPMFVPRGTTEDDGYVLVVEYAGSKQRCYLVILEARRIGRADAVIAKLEVPKHLIFPIGFHGFWDGR